MNSFFWSWCISLFLFQLNSDVVSCAHAENSIQEELSNHSKLLAVRQKLQSLYADEERKVPWKDYDVITSVSYKCVIKYARRGCPHFAEIEQEIWALKMLNAARPKAPLKLIGFFYTVMNRPKNSQEIESFQVLVVVIEAVTNQGAFTMLSDISHIHENNSSKDFPLLAFQLAEELFILHQLGVAHCDLKMENVMLSSQNRPIIIDFGLSTFFSTSNPEQTFDLPLICGTELHLAPEFKNSSLKTPKIDWYSYGVTIYRLYFLLMFNRHSKFTELRSPRNENHKFHNKSKNNQLGSQKTTDEDILKRSSQYRQQILEFIRAKNDSELIELFEGLLHEDPKKRWSFEEIRKCQFFKRRLFNNPRKSSNY